MNTTTNESKAHLDAPASTSCEANLRVGINATPEAVDEALTDTKKLAAWWTSDTRGDGTRVGSTLEFWLRKLLPEVRSEGPPRRQARHLEGDQGRNGGVGADGNLVHAHDQRRKDDGQLPSRGLGGANGLLRALLDEVGDVSPEPQGPPREGERSSRAGRPQDSTSDGDQPASAAVVPPRRQTTFSRGLGHVHGHVLAGAAIQGHPPPARSSHGQDNFWNHFYRF